jgi:hypothetical protein
MKSENLKYHARKLWVAMHEDETPDAIELCHECNHEADLITHFDAMLKINIEVCAECLEVVKDAENNVN